MRFAIHRLLPLLLALAPGAAAASEGAEAGPGPTGEERRLDLGAVPLVSFDSDLGLGLGFNAGLFLRAPGYRPYQASLTAQAYFTTGGVQFHLLKLEAPQLLGRATACG